MKRGRIELPVGFLPVQPTTPQRERWNVQVWDAVSTIPDGRVATYGDVAAFLGRPRRARQVGWALAALPPDTDVPWQRVINRLGEISLRGDLDRPIEQRRRLEAEGVVFDPGDRCDLAALRYRWNLPEAPQKPPKGPRRR